MFCLVNQSNERWFKFIFNSKEYLTDVEYFEFLCDVLVDAIHSNNLPRILFINSHLDKLVKEKYGSLSSINV